MDDSNQDTEALRKDLDALRKDLKELADDVRSSGEQHAQESLEQMRQYYSDLRQQAGKRGKEVSDEIEARPFTSVLAAFGIGLVLGRLFGR